MGCEDLVNVGNMKKIKRMIGLFLFWVAIFVVLLAPAAKAFSSNKTSSEKASAFVFPNPIFKGDIATLRLNPASEADPQAPYFVKVFDAAGDLQFECKMDETAAPLEQTLETKNLKPGIYTVLIRSTDYSFADLKTAFTVLR